MSCVTAMAFNKVVQGIQKDEYYLTAVELILGKCLYKLTKRTVWCFIL